jgi:hypothetical protein
MSALESVSPTPQGLAAISDSMEIPRESPIKPNIVQRLALNIGLLFFHLITWTVQLCNWILKNIFGYASRQKRLYNELHHIATNGDVNKIEEFLTRHAEEASAAGFLFGEFLYIPELHSHLSEILKGANVCFSRDNGFFCRRWSEQPGAYQRTSSHVYQGEECYAIGHFLFWLDPDGNTRFQFEKSPFLGFFSTVNHIIDYLRYKRDNEQQGVTGASCFTESCCLICKADPTDFLIRKINSGDPL